MPETPRFPDLARVQDLVWQLIAAPEGVEEGARDLVGRGLLESEELELFALLDVLEDWDGSEEI